jgi:hypothetical protein
VDPALLEALGLHVGDSVLLGDSALRIAALIAQEPDRGAGFMSFAPRVMINAADLPATALVQPASRVTYRLALAGPEPAVRRFTAWAEAELKQPGVRGVRLESLASGRPEMRRPWGGPRNSSTWWRCWRRCCRPWPWRWRRALCRPPARRRRHAARAGPAAAHHGGCVCARVSAGGAGGQRGRRRPGLGLHHVFVGLLAGWWMPACPRPAPGPPWPAWAWA